MNLYTLIHYIDCLNFCQAFFLTFFLYLTYLTYTASGHAGAFADTKQPLGRRQQERQPSGCLKRHFKFYKTESSSVLSPPTAPSFSAAAVSSGVFSASRISISSRETSLETSLESSSGSSDTGIISSSSGFLAAAMS